MFMRCSINNETEHHIAFRSESYFYSGEFKDVPTDVQPHSTMNFSVCRVNILDWEGATGGAKFYLIVGEGANAVEYPFALGYCVPCVGHYKASVVGPRPDVEGSPSGVDAYDACLAEGGSITFTVAGKPFLIVAAAGETSQYTISETEL
ncbi:hypothetical protein DFP72DRAFT_1114542 [Ephemerocybe angulata]|uniref:Uncharacterized protein n=1 Tax=Ephemerocybe angulata TaxID=980116 RepID=A0A8H6M5X6_9AGAR|nr:hypothetical protein DFP72DRAFT_1114542 [Tulosesus angulatus]